jgi:YD repeat-containing protein
MTVPGTGAATLTAATAYDAAGMPDSTTDWQGRVTEVDHDADGKPAATRRPNGVRTAHGYDDAGRLTGLSHYGPSGAALAEFGYLLDANGNRTRLDVTGTAVASGTETYAYDALDRLTGVTYPNGGAASYEYDAGGNRTRVTSGPTVTTYEVDAAGQLTRTVTGASSQVFTHDAAGNRTAAGPAAYAYDWAGRLVSGTTPSGTLTYAYAGDGLRVRRHDGVNTTPTCGTARAGCRGWWTTAASTSKRTGRSWPSSTGAPGRRSTRCRTRWGATGSAPTPPGR